jgi:hypothetical protein
MTDDLRATVQRQAPPLEKDQVEHLIGAYSKSGERCRSGRSGLYPCFQHNYDTHDMSQKSSEHGAQQACGITGKARVYSAMRAVSGSVLDFLVFAIAVPRRKDIRINPLLELPSSRKFMESLLPLE